MAITDIATATSVNALLRWLLPSSNPSRDPNPVEDAVAMKAAEHLAAEARKKLGAGVNASSIRTAVAIDGARLAMLSTRQGGGDRT